MWLEKEGRHWSEDAEEIQRGTGGKYDSLYSLPSPPSLSLADRLPSGRQSKTQEYRRQRKTGPRIKECHGAVRGKRYVDLTD